MFVTDENAERPETDDEGIERDSGDSDDDRMGNRAFNFESILEVSKIHSIFSSHFTSSRQFKLEKNIHNLYVKMK